MTKKTFCESAALYTYNPHSRALRRVDCSELGDDVFRLLHTRVGMGCSNWYDGLLLDIDKVQSALDGYHPRIGEPNYIPYQASAKLLESLQKMAAFVKRNRMDPKYTFVCSQTLPDGSDVFC